MIATIGLSVLGALLLFLYFAAGYIFSTFCRISTRQMGRYDPTFKFIKRVFFWPYYVILSILTK